MIKKPKVMVLLSTYNGEKYLRELVDSVLNQVDVDIQMLVRDDGSSDDTIRILESYNDPRILIYTGKNLKPARSFMNLLENSLDCDYYAYCDQDDVWYPDKLISAVRFLKEDNQPALYISTYDVVDSSLNKMFTYDMNFSKQLDLHQSLIYRSPSGCTMVFNKALRNILKKSNPAFIRMHDFWTLLTTEAFHYSIYTDNIAKLAYRQHENESVGITPSISTRIKRLIHSVFRNKNERLKQAQSLYNSYSDKLPLDSKEILYKVINYKNGFKYKYDLLTDKNFRTGDHYIDSLFIISVILGLF